MRARLAARQPNHGDTRQARNALHRRRGRLRCRRPEIPGRLPGRPSSRPRAAAPPRLASPRRPPSAVGLGLGYLGDETFDPDALLAELVLALGSDRIDLVNLTGAGGLLRYRAARDAVVLHQADPEAFERFWMATVLFWCDVEPVLRRGYEAILAGLDR